MIDTKTLTITELRKKLSAKEVTVREVAEVYLENIKKTDGGIHAYLEVFDDVLEQADLLQKKVDAGEDLPLLGVPMAMKDNILLKGRIASAASKMLEKYTAVYDATAVVKLKEAGALFLGRTNMDEFAMGGSTENSAYGPTKNPCDTTRVPGGSSGGSAASVAGDMALVAIGSDTGGSIRQPASFCGCVGLKPTYGRVSRYGLMAMGSSLDQIGPLTKTVADTEVLYNVLKGQDPMDSTSISEDTYSVSPEVKTVGVPIDLLDMEGLDPVVLENFQETLKKLEGEGYILKDVSFKNLSYALAAYYVIMPAEVSSNMARFDGVKYGLRVEGKDLNETYCLSRAEGFGKEVKRRIMLGTYVLSSGYYDAYYSKALSVKTLIQNDLEKMFADVDVIATPTAPTPAFKLGEKTNDPLQMYLEDIFTVPANIAGIPAISVPSGFASIEGKELPLGIQFFAPHGGEERLFSIGRICTGE